MIGRPVVLGSRTRVEALPGSQNALFVAFVRECVLKPLWNGDS